MIYIANSMVHGLFDLWKHFGCMKTTVHCFPSCTGANGAALKQTAPKGPLLLGLNRRNRPIYKAVSTTREKPADESFGLYT